MPTSRRKIIKTIASAAVASPLAAQHVHTAASQFVQIAATPASYKPKFFSEAQLETVRLLADLIIPRTDTPGAADAGVHRFIDTDIFSKPAFHQPWRDALSWVESEAQRVGGKPFASLTEDKQIEILKNASASTSAAGWPAFAVIKGATVDAYYGTREGLQRELGWNANTFLPEFKGCTHKEHQS